MIMETDNRGAQETGVADSSSAAVADTQASVDETATTEDSSVVAGDTSSEDNNTPSGKEDLDDTVSQAMSEVKTDKGVKRVQQLAQRAKTTEDKLKQIEAQEQQVSQAEQQTRQAINAGVAPQYTIEQINQAKQNLRDAKRDAQLEKVNIDNAYIRAEAVNPRLNPASNDYDEDFAAIVDERVDAAVTRGIPVTTELILEYANATERLIRKGESRGAAQAAELDEQKAAASTTVGQKNTQAPTKADPKAEARKRFMQTGRAEDVMALLEGV